MKHIWSVLCKKTVIDQETNNISLLESLEELKFEIRDSKLKGKAINIPFDFELVSYWIKDDSSTSKFDSLIELYDSKKRKIAAFPGKINFPKDKKRLRTRLKIQGIGITENYGTYVFKVSVKREKDSKYSVVSEIPLDIKVEFKEAGSI